MCAMTTPPSTSGEAAVPYSGRTAGGFVRHNGFPVARSNADNTPPIPKVNTRPPATAGVDYNTAGGGLFFPAGTTSRTVTVAVRGDTALEGNETFFVNLTAPVNATIADGQGLGTITNDD